jgi:hypothetical protein
MSSRVRIGVIVIAALAGFVVLLEVLERVSPAPEGPRSSSYATSPQGLAGYASVLQRAGHPIRRLRTSVTDDPPPTDATLIVLDPDVMEPDEAQAIGDWVRSGGRLVAGGAGDSGWLDEVIPHVPVWEPGGETEREPLLPVIETSDVEEVRAYEFGGWHELGNTLPVIGPADAPLVVTARSGEGSVALLADTSPLHNRALDQADNAMFGLNLVGGARKPVAFLETVHGYGASRGLGGLPTNVKWVLIGLALTTLVALWAAGRRFGPIEDSDESLPPPRIEYVDALASSLARTKPDKEARP